MLTEQTSVRPSDHPELGRIVSSEKTAATLNRVWDAMHPPSHIVAAAALYLHAGEAKTTDVGDVLQRGGHETGVYGQLFRSDAIVQVNEVGQLGQVQTARFIPFAEYIHYPELCALSMHWMAEHGQGNPAIFSGKGTPSEKIGLLVDAYLQSGYDLPEGTRDLLRTTSDLARKQHHKKSKGGRSFIRQSLQNDGFATRNGTSGVSLTQSGESLVRDVIVPYCMLLTDQEVFMSSPQMQTARQRLVLNPDTRGSDLNTYGDRLRSFSNSWKRA